ncbi:MAG: toll/interleukin-1 receptor domain-containing protein [Alphaproteobacteria bacterium]|nr:MAG: toll/interleukin-1 receptor domain-containing protein [Alphaproteobacteria bacterium]
MVGKIFINYRREDARAEARNVHDRLARVFGTSNVFMDVDKLVAGQRFDQELEKALARSDVFLAIIGPRWENILATRQASGERDYVREEIAGALQREVLVIPVLVDAARLPIAASLPDDLKPLLLHQKHDLGHEHFGRDIDSLAAAIRVHRKARESTGVARLGFVSSWRALIAASAAAIIIGGTLFAWRQPVLRDPLAIEPAKSSASSPDQTNVEARETVQANASQGAQEQPAVAAKQEIDSDDDEDPETRKEFETLEQRSQVAREKFRAQVRVVEFFYKRGDELGAIEARTHMRDLQVEANDLAMRSERLRLLLLDQKNDRRRAREGKAPVRQTLALIANWPPGKVISDRQGNILKLVKTERNVDVPSSEPSGGRRIPSVITRQDPKRIRDLSSGWLILTKDDEAVLYDQDAKKIAAINLTPLYEKTRIKSDSEMNWQIAVHDVAAGGSTLFFNVGCAAFYKEVPADCGYIAALDPIAEKLKWRTPRLMSAGQFVLTGNLLLTGGGSIRDTDFVTVIDASDGKILQQITVDSSPQRWDLKGDQLEVISFKKTRYRFKLQ